MILYGKKTIHKWAFWRKRSKLVYCQASGLLYSFFMFIGYVLFKLLIGSQGNILLSSVGIAAGGFLVLSFLSIAHWHINEKRYKDWLKKST